MSEPEVGWFAIHFAQALTALRRAADDNETVMLTGPQARALVEAIRMMEVKGE